jgi:predicted CopG family antitoxin
MKEISLTDEAYDRLSAWRESPEESFSAIVLRVVPARNTLAEMLAGFRQLPPLTEKQARIMEETVAAANNPQLFMDYFGPPE